MLDPSFETRREAHFDAARQAFAAENALALALASEIALDIPQPTLGQQDRLLEFETDFCPPASWQIHQYAEHAGMLAGLPNEELNNAFILQARQDVQEIIEDEGQVASIAPMITMQTSGISHPSLPAYATTLVLDHGGSHLAVACFSDELGLDEACLNAVKSIDWKSLSTEINW